MFKEYHIQVQVCGFILLISFIVIYYCLMAFHLPTTILAHPSPKDTPKTHISVNPKDLWNELKEVTEGSIDTATRDKAPKHLFQPTSFPQPRLWCVI